MVHLGPPTVLWPFLIFRRLRAFGKAFRKKGLLSRSFLGVPCLFRRQRGTHLGTQGDMYGCTTQNSLSETPFPEDFWRPNLRFRVRRARGPLVAHALTSKLRSVPSRVYGLPRENGTTCPSGVFVNSHIMSNFEASPPLMYRHFSRFGVLESNFTIHPFLPPQCPFLHSKNITFSRKMSRFDTRKYYDLAFSLRHSSPRASIKGRFRLIFLIFCFFLKCRFGCLSAGFGVSSAGFPKQQKRMKRKRSNS